MVIRPLLAYVRELIQGVLQAGDTAIDGTVGNGYDTQFLAECVGEAGHVFGFDIQEQALRQAKQRLAEAGLLKRVTLLQESHERMRERVPVERQERVKAITFNLGYLPGGDMAVVTTAHSTIPALQAALDLLAEGGVMTVMLYTGHEVGKSESQAVLAWAAQLALSEVHVLQYRFLNQRNDPPLLLAFEKRKRKNRPS